MRPPLFSKKVKLLWYAFVTSGRGAEYCDQPVCVCACVCVCPPAYLWNRWADLCEILCADPLWPWLDYRRAALRYVMYFRFYG